MDILGWCDTVLWVLLGGVTLFEVMGNMLWTRDIMRTDEWYIGYVQHSGKKHVERIYALAATETGAVEKLH